MCGIFGYLGKRRNAIAVVLEGLQKLEYRGYDSAGLAAIRGREMVFQKTVGNVSRLKEHVESKNLESYNAIGHTRWATHGVPSEKNAHPQIDQSGKCSLIHNGIIENHEWLRRLLQKRGVKFRSDTDTEVIVQLIGHLYKGNFLKAVQKAIPLLEGAYAIAMIHQDHPGEIICAAKDSPLAIGIGEGEMFIASDSRAFSSYTTKATYLQASEVALVNENSIQAYNSRLVPINKAYEDLGQIEEEPSKGIFQHYTLKEIYEQPQAAQNALLSRYSEKYGTAILDELKYTEDELQKVERIVIVACGTAYHAGVVAAYMLEEMARIPVQVEISSEFRYKNPIILDNTLAIVISQSGETADTLAAMRELKEKNAKIVGVCNVQGSTLAREVESTLFLRAGPEIGVCASKTFISQIIVLSLITLRLARMRQMSQQEGKKFIEALKALPDQIRAILSQKEEAVRVAKKYASHDNFFFLGRRFMYPTALEGALKLKEIAYINANAYAAGEMKHGPIALIDEECPTVAFCADSLTYPKMLSNLMEVKARRGKIVAIATEGASDLAADDILRIPETVDPLATILSTIWAQQLAYYIALENGCEIDQPRNLAKTVTVE